jgi:hypothetical protein
MKTKYLITALWMSLMILFTGPLFAQVKLPADFEQKTKAKYSSLKHKENSFEKYLEYEKLNFTQQSNLLNAVAALYNGCDEVNTICGNGDFESGLNTAEWDGAFGALGTNGEADPASMTEGITGGALTDLNAHQTIVTAGADPATGISMVAPGGSTKALRIGNNQAGGQSELISKRITVTNAQTIINFSYAVVFEDPNHSPVDQPAFWVRVIDCATGNEITGVVNLGNGNNKIIADAADPFFQSAQGGAIAFRNWSCGQINLSAHIGKTVSVQYIVEDCAPGGHFGYAYLDNVCGACAGNQGSLSLSRVSACGSGQICFNYTLPQNPAGQTGTAQISLNIYQNGVLLQTIPGPVLSSGSLYCFSVNPAAITGINDQLGGFDYTATATFGLNGFVFPFVLGNPPTGQVAGQNNDYRIYCIDQCCPGRNVVRNPGFEEGNLYFSSAYLPQSVVAAGSVSPGKYGVITSSQALTVASAWNVNCTNNGRHLVVNGATGTGLNKIAWSQTVTVVQGKTYKFCADMKNLPQCSFDVKPKVDVVFSVPGFDLNDVIVNVPAGACNWQNVSQVITIPGNSGNLALTIRILLDEVTAGDGNDLAIDNITVVEIAPVPQADVLFNVAFTNVTASSFGISATPVAPLGRNCGFYWEVGELDANDNYVPFTAVYNPPQWWSFNTNTFNGYNGTSTLTGNNAGVFDIKKRYRIVYGRWCECAAWNSYAVIVDPLRMAGQITTVKDDKYVLTPAQIAAITAGAYNATPQITNNASLVQQKAAGFTVAKESASKLKLYPNPVNDNLAVTMPAKSGAGKLIISNIAGVPVSETAVEQGQYRMNVNTAALTPGTYTIRFVAAGGEVTAFEKFVKMKK